MELLVPKSIIADLALDVLYWPIWWYTFGFLKVVKFVFSEIRSQSESLGVGVWLKNLFVPMYGMYDFESRIISFLVRLAELIGRSLLLLIWSLMLFIIILFWLVLPLIIISQIIANI
jgi:hypothetical protein